MIHQNKANTSGFVKKVKLKKYKLPFFPNGGLNNVIEGFSFQKQMKKMSLKVAQMSLMSIYLISNIAIQVLKGF